MKQLIVREWYDWIPLGKGDGYLDDRDVRQLEQWVKAIGKEDLVEWKPGSIRFRNHVGVIRLAGTQIEILPKIEDLEEPASRIALLKMLRIGTEIVSHFSRQLYRRTICMTP